MSKNYDYDYEYDYEDEYNDHTNRSYGRKKPGKGKGHQFGRRGTDKRRQDYWNMQEDDAYESDYESLPTNRTKYTNPSSKSHTPPSTPFSVADLQGEFVREIKGSKIDFTRLTDIQSVDSLLNGKQTYGIKFLFKGKKGLFRTVWFHTRLADRDKMLTDVLSFWEKAKASTGGKA
jgi:hypothetical protein